MFNPNDIPKEVIKLCETLKEHGFTGYLVGGSVRDLLLNQVPVEWDLTTDAAPDQVTALFAKVVPTGVEYGTVTVLLEDQQFEVTTFRSDEKYSDGRHPDKVKFTKSLDEDLARRDFSINAMAYAPLSQKFVDNFDGQKDLKAKLIRSVGSPLDRFLEDGLRPLRACRFAAKLGFKIEDLTLAAIPKTLEIYKKVAPERIREELIKMLSSAKPSLGFEYMRISGLLKVTFPELEAGFGVTQPKPFHVHDVYYHNLATCDAASPKDPLLRLAGLFHDLAKPQCKEEDTFYGHDQKGAELTEQIMQRLRFSNKDIARVSNLVKNHMFNYKSEWTDAAVRRFILRVGEENIADLFDLRRADVAAMEREIGSEYLVELKSRIQGIFAEQNALQIKDLALSGEDVMEILKIKPSPKVGEILRFLLERVLDEPALNTKEKLTKIVKENSTF